MIQGSDLREVKACPGLFVTWWGRFYYGEEQEYKKHKINKFGYKEIDGMLAAELVAEAWLPNPKKLNKVRLKKGKTCIKLNNLEWVDGR